MRRLFLLLFLTILGITAQAYHNPVVYADYSDPDVCVGPSGNDYYLTASSFNCIPGLPIMHSTDLVHWRLVNYALRELLPYDRYDVPQHGKGVWAPSIRYNSKTHLFYIYWGDPDMGVFVVTAEKPEGEWSEPHLVIEGKGIIDPTVFWDEDGRCYMVNAYANSRARINSVLSMRELTADGMHVKTQPRIVFDGSSSWNHTCEGPKMYKRDGWYWILCPAGGVKIGHQLAMRARSPYGPYEEKVVLQRGSTDVNGPHQGSLVEKTDGTSWFLHFQDREAYGRILWLEPVDWASGWPIMGNNGIPVKEGKMTGEKALKDDYFSQATDEFNGDHISLAWQWNANYKENYGQLCCGERFRLFCQKKSEHYQNLLEMGGVLLQKLPAEHFTATTKLRLTAREDGQYGGLICMGNDYTALAVKRAGDTFELQQITYLDADRNNDSARDPGAVTGTEDATTIARLTPTAVDGEGFLPHAIHRDVWLRLEITYTGGTVPAEYPTIGGQQTIPKHGSSLQFYYSLDGKSFKKAGTPFVVRQNKWTGAKIGLFAMAPFESRNSGWIDADWFRVVKK